MSFITDRHTLDNGTVVLHTPLWLPNGDGICPFATAETGGWRVTDGRHAFVYLYQRPLALTPARRRTLRRIAQANGLVFSDGTFSTQADDRDLDDAVRCVAQAQLQAAVLPMIDP